MTSKIKTCLTLFSWALIFFIIGVFSAKANNIALQYGVFYPQYVRNANCDVEKILIEKSKNKMSLVDCNGNIVKTYIVRTGYNKGPKTCDGDLKTPEGEYKIIKKRDSQYIKFLEIDYPRAKDVKAAKEKGCNPGNAIGIHYYNSEIPAKYKNGSHGCITVYNKNEIKEIDNLVSVGTKVEIKE